MSVNASKHELIQLIHRHLKEQGFNSAADELQKQSPQNEASTSTTLEDIYSSWLKSSKRKAKCAASKHTTENKRATPKKAAQKKKTDRTTKEPGKLDKKSTPPKRKKGNVKADNVNSNKSNSPKKDVPVPGGGEDSDSDSSLDVEKWKKLVQHMTDSDIVKINEFNALTQPKRQRVRKPRAKPNAKIEVQQSNGQVQESEKPENSTEGVSADVNETKKSRQKKPISIKINKVQKCNVIAPVTSVISPQKDLKKEKRKAESPADPPEPKRKKKKDASKKKLEEPGGDKNMDNNQAKVEAKYDNPTKENLTEQSKVNTADIDIEHTKKKKKDASKKKENGGLIDKSIDNNQEPNDNPTEGMFTEQSTINPIIDESKSKKKKKKKKKEKETLKENVIDSGDLVDKIVLAGTTIAPSLTQNSTINDVVDESIVKVKQGKKRKRDKMQDDVGQSEEPDTNINKEIKNTTEEHDQNIVEMVPKKDKKKEEPETLEEKVIDETVIEDVSEQVSVKKKSKKKKKEALDDLVSERTEEEQVQDSENVNTPKTKEGGDGHDASVMTSERKKKKEKKLSVSTNSEVETQLILPSTPQTPSLSTKKKKSKSTSEEITQTQADTASEILEHKTPKKKKKKSSKTSETEN